MNRENKVTIVIPNYNGLELLKENLPSVIEAYNNKNNRIGEIIIVDDASEDNSVLFIKKNFPQVRVIRHSKNRGFSATVNTGARSSKGELLVLLNTDVTPEVKFLEKAVVHFDKPETFAVSLHEVGYGYAIGKFVEGFIVHEPGKEVKNLKETFWVNGGSGVFRRKQWMELGGMDEKLLSPYYWEDVDLCYRAMKRGLKLLWEPDSLVKHEHESTISKVSKKKRLKVQERNQLIVIWKNITSENLFRKHIAGLIKRISRSPGYIKIVFAALMKINLIIKARKKEKKECKVSDEAIFAKF